MYVCLQTHISIYTHVHIYISSHLYQNLASYQEREMTECRGHSYVKDVLPRSPAYWCSQGAY